MPSPLRSLPVIQNWACHSCSDCCRIEAVVTDDEKQRIEALELVNDPEVAPQPWFTSRGWDAREWTLNHRSDGRCVFLTSANRCRLQERFGVDAKPFVCRLFPFVLIPAGNHWRVGMRYSCPSAAKNRGPSLADSEKELVHLARLLEQHIGKSAGAAPSPLLQAGQQLAWPDICRIAQVLVELVQDRSDRLERRLRKCLTLASFCVTARPDDLRGNRLVEYLELMRAAVESEVPRAAADVPPPSGLLGRVLFRALLAIFARRDRAGRRSIRGRLGRVLVGWRFVRGRGLVPRINGFLPEASFEEIERHRGIPLEIDEILERYYVIKLNSLQFFGAANFDLPFWNGLESLVLTLPMIAWLRCAFNDVPPAEAAQQAIQLVDDHFGGNPLLGFPHFLYLQRILGQRGELAKLVAWYGK